MPELRKDLAAHRVIVADNALKPDQFPINRNQVSAHFDGSDCPFCEGREACTTQEIAAVRLQGSLPDSPGWLVRTVPNKYAAFNLEGELHRSQTGLFECFNGLGHHEVVIETPWHYQEIHQRSPEHIEHLYRLLRQRYRDLKQDPRIKYIQIYKTGAYLPGLPSSTATARSWPIPWSPDKMRP